MTIRGNRQATRLLLFLLLLTAVLSVYAQHGQRMAFPGGPCYYFRLTLCDKQGTPFRTDRPEQFLSQRAIDRRVRQHLPVDSTDLPLTPVYLESIRVKGGDIISQSKWNNTVVVRSSRPDAWHEFDTLPFVREVKTVFASPDSVKIQARDILQREAQPADTISRWGAACEQMGQLNGLTFDRQTGCRGSGKMIAVIDGGFMNVDSIAAFCNIEIVGWKDFVVPQSSDFFAEQDHGTMVLSTMAANAPGYMIGTAPEASYLLLRSETGWSESLVEEDFWAAAAEYADSVGVDLINTSLGYSSFDDKASSHCYADLDGHCTLISHTASMLAGKGIVLVSSAGNEGNGTWKKITVPGDAEDMITVGAVDYTGLNVGFSSVGPSADGRVKPDVMARGSAVACISGKGIVGRHSGTSFASPLVCGLIACLWQACPALTARELIDLVRRSASQYATPDNIFGYGIPDFSQAWESCMTK